MKKSLLKNKEKFRLSCSLYELVELWSLKNKPVELCFLDEKGKEQIYKGIVTNIYAREGLEQIVLDDNLIITTKNIIRINNVKFQ